MTQAQLGVEIFARHHSARLGRVDSRRKETAGPSTRAEALGRDDSRRRVTRLSVERQVLSAKCQVLGAKSCPLLTQTPFRCTSRTHHAAPRKSRPRSHTPS